MVHSLKVGCSFGITSGILTTMGLMVGLHSTTESRLVLIGGILTIAIADSISDALGIHISEESENVHTAKEIWIASFFTLLSKFIFTLTFIVPILLFNLSTAIKIAVIWGLAALSIVSFRIAKAQCANPWIAVIEHLVVAFLVITLTHLVGDWIALKFR